ncbi:MAG TPA: hypothetical protein H9875_08200 [Candidatus Levilactobacillus faecigallinarum]|uniref:Uncharacterized protein n=1 Tax=Candidatus Levilactobacillus faecigallinarum TaxID=2838638 RepID=A0A9D1QSC5_9LACO|nr:hypothetical protein [Candidatus Levilactobacillus faecigallinarum]
MLRDDVVKYARGILSTSRSGCRVAYGGQTWLVSVMLNNGKLTMREE